MTNFTISVNMTGCGCEEADAWGEEKILTCGSVSGEWSTIASLIRHDENGNENCCCPTVLCPIPPLSEGHVAMTIWSSTHDSSTPFSILPSTTLHFTVVSPPITTKVTPASAFSSGGTKVSVSGWFPSNAQLICEFGLLLPPVRADRISATEVICKTPRSPPGILPLRVILEGESAVANFSSGLLRPMWSTSTTHYLPLSFSIVPDFSLSRAGAITVKGSYWLIIYGANIPRAPDLQCVALVVDSSEECSHSACAAAASSHVSEVSSPGKWLNSTSVICPMWFQDHCSQQESVVPTAGLSAMGRQQYLIHSVTMTAVDAYLNLQQYPVEIWQTPRGWREITVLSIAPLIASPGGGAEITVTVHNKSLLPQRTDTQDNSIRLACLFESHDHEAQVLAIPVSIQEAVCISPAWPVSPGPVQVSLIRGLPWNFEVVATTMSPVFSFGPTPSILGLVESIPKGDAVVDNNTSGGTVSRLILSITGIPPGIVAGSTGQTLVCLFSFGGGVADQNQTKTTEAFPTSETRVFCDTPPLPVGQVFVSLALMSHESNTNSVLTNSIPFMVSSASPRFREAIPIFIAQTGGERIRVVGEELIEFAADLLCMFGNMTDDGGEDNMAVTVPAIYISPTEIVCIAPPFHHAPVMSPIRIIGSTLPTPLDAGLISVLPLAPGLSAFNQPVSSLTRAYGHAIGSDEVPICISMGTTNSNMLSSKQVILQSMITQIVCKFILKGKSISVPAILANEPYCVTPSFDGLVIIESYDYKELVEVSIVLEMGSGEYASLASTTSYLLLPTPMVVSIHPSTLSNGMGESIIVRGSGFLNTDSICCIFSRSVVGKRDYYENDSLPWSAPAIWISWDVVSCQSPPISYFSESGSIVKLYISLNCAPNAVLENEGLHISFVPRGQGVEVGIPVNPAEETSATAVSYDPMGVLAHSLFPQVGPTSGGGMISVQLWEDAGPIWWDSCIYHGSYGSPAVQVLANINGSCAIPEWPYPESVFVELSSSLEMDGIINPTHTPSIRLPFDFVETPALLLVTPDVLIAQRSQVVRLRVLPLFKPLDGLQCAFVSDQDGTMKDQLVIRDALFISEHEISCMSPQLSVGNTTRVHLLLHGQPFSSPAMPLGFALTVLPQPVAFQTKLLGPGGMIIVKGESLARFAAYLHPKCLVGDRIVPSVSLNDSALLCIIGNGEGLYAETETTAMSSITSTNSSSFVFAPVQLLLGTKDEIVIPVGDVTLLPRPIVLMFTPAEVAEHGGTIVVISGYHLSGALCRFGDEIVVPSYPSSISEGGLEQNFTAIGSATAVVAVEAISCETPPISQVFAASSDGQTTTQSVTFAVSTDGGMGYVSVGMIRYIGGTLTLPIVDSITPSSGHHTGGTIISIYGRGLRPIDIHRCQFVVPHSKSDGIIVPGRWVSSSHFQCIAPPLSLSSRASAVRINNSESTVVTSVKVLINGKDTTSTNGLYFRYFTAPNSFDVVATPLVGTTLGGALISISGKKLESMKLTDRGGVSCMFGSASPSPAVEISPDSIACLSPIGTPGSVMVKIIGSIDGLELFQFPYAYVKPSFVARTYPSTIDTSRLPDGLTAIGEDFVPGFDICCHLISLSDKSISITIDADYLSDDRVWCKLDPHLVVKVGSYSVQVWKIVCLI